MDVKHQEEHDSDAEGEESEEEKDAGKTGKNKKKDKPNNKPYEKMKTIANPRAWEQFTQDFHEETDAAKGAGLQKKEAAEQKNKDWYAGTFDQKGTKYEGWGVLVMKKDGSIYQGEFKKHKPEGHGRWFYGKGKTEGNAVKGAFKAGKLVKGNGEVHLANGDTWDGEINIKGLPHGSGKLKEKVGTEYTGIMKAGVKNDKMAKEVTKEGSVYEGGFKAGLKDGKGKTTQKKQQPKYQQWQKGVAKKDITEAAWKKG